MRKTAILLASIVLCSKAFAGNGIIWRADRPIAGEYIVVLADQRTVDVDAAAAALARAHGGTVIVPLKYGIKGFGIRIPARANAEALARNPLVDHVEENGEVQLSDAPSSSAILRQLLPIAAAATSRLRPKPMSNHCPWSGYYYQCAFSDASFWHLDRLDELSLPDDWIYNAAHTGYNINVYLLGTGVLATHEQFEGNVLPGVTFGDGLPANNPCGGFPDAATLATYPYWGYGPGHDTAVASIVAGKTNGVAKDATIIPLKTIKLRPGLRYLYSGKYLVGLLGA